MKASSCLVVLTFISIAVAYGPAFVLSDKGYDWFLELGANGVEARGFITIL